MTDETVPPQPAVTRVRDPNSAVDPRTIPTFLRGTQMDSVSDLPTVPQSPSPQPTRRANDMQVDGDHYRKLGNLQPWDTWVPWQLNPFQGEIQKLVVRYASKNGIRDLQKAKHYIDKLIEVEMSRGVVPHSKA